MSAAGRRPSRHGLVPAWLLPVAVGTVIAVTGAVVFWFAYLGPMRGQLEAARVYYENGDYTRAAEELGKVLERDANQVDALLGLARVKAATGDSADALALYVRVIERRPDDATVLYETASLQRLLGNTNAAVPHLEAALKAEPDSALYLSELVKAYVATGKARVAAGLLLERADDTGRADAERADLYVRAAAAFVEARADSDVKATLQKALELAPKHPEATRMLRQFK